MTQLLREVLLATGQVLIGSSPALPSPAQEQRLLGTRAITGDFLRVAADMTKSAEKHRVKLEEMEQSELAFYGR